MARTEIPRPDGKRPLRLRPLDTAISLEDPQDVLTQTCRQRNLFIGLIVAGIGLMRLSWYLLSPVLLIIGIFVSLASAGEARLAHLDVRSQQSRLSQ